MSEVYLLDANAFIQPKQKFYALHCGCEAGIRRGTECRWMAGRLRDEVPRDRDCHHGGFQCGEAEQGADSQYRGGIRRRVDHPVRYAAPPSRGTAVARTGMSRTNRKAFEMYHAPGLQSVSILSHSRGERKTKSNRSQQRSKGAKTFVLNPCPSCRLSEVPTASVLGSNALRRRR